MNHQEFVEKYKSGEIEVAINRSVAFRVMQTTAVQKKYFYANLFWSWIWILFFPASIICFIYVRRWVGVLVFLLGLALPRAIKESASSFVLEQALEDGEFYEKAIESSLIKIRSPEI